MDMHKSLTVPLTTKASDELSQTGTFSGYGSVFDSIDRGGDTIKRGAFAGTIKAMADQGQMPAMLWAHDSSEPIGEWVEMREDDKGLFVKGVLWVEGNTAGRAPVANAEKARNLMLANGPKGLSIGGMLSGKDGSEMIEMGGERVRQIKEFSLWEVSPCVFAMEPKAAVTDIKTASNITPRMIERACINSGMFSRTAAKAFVADTLGQRDADSDESKRDACKGKMSQSDLSRLLGYLKATQPPQITGETRERS